MNVVKERIPWYYMWTPNFELFHHIIQISFVQMPRLHKDFSLRPFYFEQALFNKQLSKQERGHAFTGSNLKVDLMIQCIEQNMGKYFIFTDADIFIASDDIYDMCEPFMKHGYDCVYMKEQNDDANREINIGFILTKANEKMLAFWKEVQKRVAETNGHDQHIASHMHMDENDVWNIHWGIFSRDDVMSNKTYRGKPFKITQMLCSCQGRVMDMAEKLYTLRRLIPLERFDYLINEEVKKALQMFISRFG